MKISLIIRTTLYALALTILGGLTYHFLTWLRKTNYKLASQQ